MPNELTLILSGLSFGHGVGSSGTTKRLDRLEQAGLITREPDPADRRVRLLAITAAGCQVRAAAQTAIQANEDRVLARLSPADRQAFLRAVKVLSALPQEEITGA